MNTKTRLIRSAGLLVMVLAVWGAGAAAADPGATGTVAQSYDAGPDVLAGMIVRPDPKADTGVVPADAKDMQKVIGVVAPIDGAEIVLTPPTASSRQVLVAPTGRYELLASNQDGAIKPGDYLTVSALSGIAMKAGSDQTEVVGRAVSGFSGQANTLETVKLKNNAGHDVTVAVGHVQADIRLAPNPLFRKQDNGLPGLLANVAHAVANKEVNPVRIYLSVAVLLATLFITGTMFYGGIKGSMTAIGRNPLAKSAIRRGMIQSTVFGLVVFILGMLAAYGVLI